MSYNYRRAIKHDIREAIEDNNYGSDEKDFNDWYELLWTDDSVTGNASGSYTFNRAKAYAHVKDNIPLLIEALTEFGYESNYIVNLISDLEYQAETADVIIRCYLLGECLQEVLQ